VSSKDSWNKAAGVERQIGLAMKLKCGWRWVIELLVITAVCGVAQGSTTVTVPFEGIRYTHRVQVVPRPLQIHLLEIDPTAAGISFLMTPDNGVAVGENTPRTATQFLTQTGAQAAINASFYFSEAGGILNRGLVASEGDRYSNFVRRHRRRRQFLSDELLDRIADIHQRENAQLTSARTDALGKCLERLPDSDRRLVETCYAGDRTIKEVACGEGRTAGDSGGARSGPADAVQEQFEEHRPVGPQLRQHVQVFPDGRNIAEPEN
jgi:hypothetical protein